MTSATGTRRTAPLRAAVTLVLLGAAAAGLAALSLGTASGVTHLGGDSYHTEFVSAWWVAAWLLVVPVFLLARWWPLLAVPATVVAAVPQFVVAHESVVRTRAAGWGDGLETLGYWWAAAMAFGFACAALVAVGTRSWWRQI